MMAMEIEIEQSLYIDGEEVESHRVRVPKANSGIGISKAFDSATEQLTSFRATVNTNLDEREPPF